MTCLTAMGRWWLEMKKPFPLFIDMEVTPPLVIGNANILLAKVRLLLKFAPVVEVITDSDTLAFAEIGQGVRQVPNVSCAAAHDHIRGRPLVMVETLEDQLMPVWWPGHGTLASRSMFRTIRRFQASIWVLLSIEHR